MKYRLIEASINGIKNIEKPVKIDFINQYPSRKALYSAHIKTIYGPNGSGKTAIITAFNLYKNILVRTDSLSDNNIPYADLINSNNKKLDMTTTFVALHRNNKMYKHHIVIDFTNPISYRLIEEQL